MSAKVRVFKQACSEFSDKKFLCMECAAEGEYAGETRREIPAGAREPGAEIIECENCGVVLAEVEVDYSKLTHDEFNVILEEVVEGYTAGQLLQIPGVYEVLSEAFNNTVLQVWEERQ